MQHVFFLETVPHVLLEELRECDPVSPIARLAKGVDEVIDASRLWRAPCHKRCAAACRVSGSEGLGREAKTALLHAQFRLGEQ